MSRPIDLNRHGFKGARDRPCIRNCGRLRQPGYSICKTCSSREHADRQRERRARKEIP